MKSKVKRIRKTFPIANRTDIPARTGPDSVYDDIRFPTIALSLLRNTGADNRILGDILGVGPNTIKTWCRKHPRFKEAVQRGRDEYDTEKVERRSLEKALGYKYENRTYERMVTGYKRYSDGSLIKDEFNRKIPIFEMVLVKIEEKELAPDNTLLIFWMKNRNKERWRDVNRIDAKMEYPDGVPGAITNNIQMNIGTILNNCSDDELSLLENLSNQQLLIEGSDVSGSNSAN